MKQKQRWWDSSVGYIIFPSSYKDGNGDGLGDLKGLISKLDYLQWLGIDLVWICPIFASPMDDNGYDVSSYEDINPLFGDNEDFKTLIKEAHNRGIRILIDFVLNHTSDEHPWFKKALSDPNSVEHGLYFFHAGKKKSGKMVAPSNWQGFFSTPAWEKIKGSNEYYLHIFSKKMPDVNWDNPEVRRRYFQIARHYLDAGVDGFRLDALAHLGKDLTFSDSDAPENEYGLAFDPSKFSNRPVLYDYLRQFKKEVLDHYDCLTVGEVGGSLPAEESLKYAGYEEGSINMVFNFDTAWCNGAYGSIDKDPADIKTNVFDLKNAFTKWHKVSHGKADLPFYWCNHDHPRALSQYGSVAYRKQSGKMLFLISLFLYGTPFIYQGDEIGMSNVLYDKPEDFYFDVGNRNEVPWLRQRGYTEERILMYLRRCSRVNARQPMQWDSSPNAGFTAAKPFLKVNPNYREGVNVEEEKKDPDSILNFVKKAIAFRKNDEINDLVTKGTFEIIDYPHPDVLAFVHKYEARELKVIANMRPYDVYFSYDGEVNAALHNYDDVVYAEPNVLKLRPFETYLIKE